MTRIALALSLVTMLVSCTSSGRQAVPEPPGSDDPTTTPSEAVGGAEGREPATCRGRATESVNGRPRRVVVEISPCRVEKGKAPRLVLVNTGPTRVGFGPGFKVEKKTARGWKWINRKQAFHLPLFYLEPGARSDPERIAIYFQEPEPLELAVGTYRVTKSVQLTPGKPRPPTMEIRARFRVVG